MSKIAVNVEGIDLSILLENVAAAYGRGIRTMRVTIDDDVDDDNRSAHLFVSVNGGPEWCAEGKTAAFDPVGELQTLMVEYANGRVGSVGNERELLARVFSLLGPAYDKLVTG